MTESAREARLQGLATEWRTMTYTWRDCALYALAVGAGGAEPQYTYERDMQAIPTFRATPYWGTVNVTPKLLRPTPALPGPGLPSRWFHGTAGRPPCRGASFHRWSSTGVSG